MNSRVENQLAIKHTIVLTVTITLASSIFEYLLYPENNALRISELISKILTARCFFKNLFGHISPFKSVPQFYLPNLNIQENSDSGIEDVKKTTLQPQSEKKKNEPFRRVKAEEIEVDPRLADNR